MKLGLYLPTVPGDVGPLDHWRALLGERLAIASMFQAWGGPRRAFDAAGMRAVRERGLVPMVTWEPWAPPGGGINATAQPAFTLDAIARGEHDGYVREWARACRDFSAPMLLRPMHEMNGDWYPWCGTVNGGSPAAYVRAWRHLHARFRDAGARNVAWVWCPYVRSYPAADGNAFEAYYPGDDVVDRVALDGFNWGTRDGAHAWTSFADLFLPAYERVAALGARPVMIAEVACAGEGGDKAAWIEAMYATLREHCPRVESLTWFQCDKERDWRADASPASLRAFLGGALRAPPPPAHRPASP